MDVKKRILLIKIGQKIEANPRFSEKIGIHDKSYFRKDLNKEEKRK